MHTKLKLYLDNQMKPPDSNVFLKDWALKGKNMYVISFGDSVYLDLTLA